MSTIATNSNPVILSRLEEIPQPLFRGVILPFAIETIILPKKVPNSVPYNEKMLFPHFVERLDKAHQLAIEWYQYGTLASINKQFNKCVQQDQNLIGNKIVELLDPIQEVGHVGTRAIRDCVDCGWYLMALKIYFICKPQNLHNKASDPTYHEGFKRNILHNAISPNYSRTISPIFIEFVLIMNKKHSLGLLEQRSTRNGTPLQGYDPKYGGLDKKNKEILQKILDNSVGKNLFQFSAPEPVEKIEAPKQKPQPSIREPKEIVSTKQEPVVIIEKVSENVPEKDLPINIKTNNENKTEEASSIWNTIANFASSFISLLLSPFRFIIRLFSKHQNN
ncbi:MAG: hypothetical protein H0W88_07990 [Parachlamydiaceae bacterium]|nr:hypothetical protein [Parachlamydiaceae bacterium]